MKATSELSVPDRGQELPSSGGTSASPVERSTVPGRTNPMRAWGTNRANQRMEALQAASGAVEGRDRDENALSQSRLRTPTIAPSKSNYTEGSSCVYIEWVMSYKTSSRTGI